VTNNSCDLHLVALRSAEDGSKCEIAGASFGISSFLAWGTPKISGACPRRARATAPIALSA
jgi:hypothetical protein